MTTQIKMQDWQVTEPGDLLVRLASEQSLQSLTNRILYEARKITGAEGGTFYRLVGEDTQACLTFSVIQNIAMGIESLILEGEHSDWKPIPLFVNGEANYSNVATHVALTGKTVNIEDAYQTHEFDFSGTRMFDRANNYRSQSFLTVPLQNHEGRVIGVIQLINAKSDSNKLCKFTEIEQSRVEAMAKFASISLDNQLLVQSHKDLLDAFIQALARIIDVRSPHTSAHCQRIPVLTKLIANEACNQKTGYFEDFNLTPDEWYELHVAAWMHDCGKLATPETILNKGTKLESLHDGFDAIAARFSVRAQTVSAEERKVLAEDLAFIKKINKGGEFMSDADKERIRQISELTWQTIEGEQLPLLRADEVENLCITRGTINDRERFTINRHIDITIDILEQLPFPPKLRRVPEYAGGHHERMDGKGYPRKLTREQMSVPARIMGVADIFEALTAKERPYKPPMPLSQAFSILQSMRNDNHIDPDVYHLFLTSECWRDYAKEHMLEKQLDVEDVSPYL